MLNMGFREAIEDILKQSNPDRQTVLFSATMPRQILSLTKRFQKDPIHLQVAAKAISKPEISQTYFQVNRAKKLPTLLKMIQQNEFNLALIFCNTKHKVDNLVTRLQHAGHNVEGLHGGKNQQQRERIMKRFRQGRTQLLVATDVAARGLDVDNVDKVFNFELPKDVEFYTHRIGRTGRAGNTGEAISLVDGSEFMQLSQIKKAAKGELVKAELPA